MKVGIDSIAFDIPKLHLPIKVLALNRNIDPDKLTNGLEFKKKKSLFTKSNRFLTVSIPTNVTSTASPKLTIIIKKLQIKPTLYIKTGELF
jgi:hypothetical protein